MTIHMQNIKIHHAIQEAALNPKIPASEISLKMPRSVAYESLDLFTINSANPLNTQVSGTYPNSGLIHTS